MTNQTVHTHSLISRSQQITAEPPNYLSQRDATNNPIQSCFGFEVLQPFFPEKIEDVHTSMHQRLEQFLKTIGANDTLKNFPNQPLPNVLFMDEEEFDQQMSVYKARRNPGQILQIP